MRKRDRLTVAVAVVDKSSVALLAAGGFSKLAHANSSFGSGISMPRSAIVRWM
jgi:hypothetical protein